MLNAGIMSKLKRVNVSVNTELTAQRLKEDYTAASKADKSAVVELSGLGRPTFYRANDTGIASAKVVLAMSQILKVSPFYYIGLDQEKTPLQGDHVIDFLKKYGYHHIAADLTAKTPDSGAKKGKDAPPVEPKGEKDGVRLSLPDISEELRSAAENMTVEDAVLLLRALMLRAEAGGQAAQYAKLVRLCLMM
jgi:hypothetical protein